MYWVVQSDCFRTTLGHLQPVSEGHTNALGRTYCSAFSSRDELWTTVDFVGNSHPLSYSIIIYIYTLRIQSSSKTMIGQTASEIILSAKSAPEWSSLSGEQLGNCWLKMPAREVINHQFHSISPSHSIPKHFFKWCWKTFSLASQLV